MVALAVLWYGYEELVYWVWWAMTGKELDNNKIQEMYKKGLSINKIAIELDVCWYSIQRRIKI